MIYNGHSGQLDDIEQTVRRVTSRLSPWKHRFDCIVTMGMSGALVGSPVALRVHKPLVVVRKPSDDCHSRFDVLNANQLVGKRYLFLDDFISLGMTYERVRRRMEDPLFCASYAGTYLYSDDVLSWDGDGCISWHPAADRFGRVRVDYRMGSNGVAA